VIETKRYGWVVWPLRISASLAALLLFDQAVFAGQFLSGTFASLHTHRENATYAGITVLVTAMCAALVRWPGRGPVWPMLACLGLFALIALQIVLGFARVLGLHIPLGVLIIMSGVHLAVWSWRYRPAPQAPPFADATEIGAADAEVRS
jgi:heme A synthase